MNHQSPTPFPILIHPTRNQRSQFNRLNRHWLSLATEVFPLLYLYMQPESNESQKILLTQSIAVTHQDSQYGLHGSDQQLPYRPLAGEGSAELTRDASLTASSISSDEGFSKALERPMRRLSSSSRPQTSSPVNRISEHENVSAHSTRKNHGGPAFTVIQKSKKLGSSQTAIVDFPNGTRFYTLDRLR